MSNWAICFEKVFNAHTSTTTTLGEKKKDACCFSPCNYSSVNPSLFSWFLWQRSSITAWIIIAKKKKKSIFIIEPTPPSEQGHFHQNLLSSILPVKVTGVLSELYTIQKGTICHCKRRTPEYIITLCHNLPFKATSQSACRLSKAAVKKITTEQSPNLCTESIRIHKVKSIICLSLLSLVCLSAFDKLDLCHYLLFILSPIRFSANQYFHYYKFPAKGCLFNSPHSIDYCLL